MIRPAQLRDLVIRPTLQIVAPSARDEAVELLLGTAAQESHAGDYIAQRRGPALGVWQMEPATEKDIWTNYLAYHPDFRLAISRFIVPGLDREGQMAGNLYYACGMAWLTYERHRDKHPIPAAGDLEGQAEIYLAVYNAGGKATKAEYLANWHNLQELLARD